MRTYLQSGADELVGLWSSGAGYHDTFSDEWLIFRADGTGRLVFLNPFDDSSHHFRWQVADQGRIDFIGTDLFGKVVDDSRRGDAAATFHFSGVRYRVEEAERPPGTGNRMRELRLDYAMPWPLASPWPTDLGYETVEYEAAEARLRGAVAVPEGIKR